MLEHGGQLYKAANTFGIPVNDWLDLSTGINPNSWPIPATLPEHIWSQLPQDDDYLLPAAKNYYNAKTLLPVAGSQAAIQALPKLRSASKVAVVAPSYAEHAHAWQQEASHDVSLISRESIDQIIDEIDVLVLVSPNNPTAESYNKQQVLNWHKALRKKQGWLIVDEAFIDPAPKNSLIAETDQDGLIVLRSLGKFFGLAGLRVGFVFSEKNLLSELANYLGPWPIAHASRYLASQALQDTHWQQQTRHSLISQSRRLKQLLIENKLAPTGCTALFQWIKTEHAKLIYQQLAEQGILIRLFSSPTSIRLGLPKTELDWSRLQSALENLKIPL